MPIKTCQNEVRSNDCMKNQETITGDVFGQLPM